MSDERREGYSRLEVRDGKVVSTGQTVDQLRIELRAAHAKLAQMAALVTEWRDEYNKQWVGTTRVDVRPHAARCDCTHCVTERAVDPDTARAGRLWEKLWAEHEAGRAIQGRTRGIAEDEKHWDRAWNAVEAERKG